MNIIVWHGSMTSLQRFFGYGSTKLFNKLCYRPIKVRYKCDNNYLFPCNPLICYEGPQASDDNGPDCFQDQGMVETWTASFAKCELEKVLGSEVQPNGLPFWEDAILGDREWTVTRPCSDEWVPVITEGDPQIDKAGRYGVKFRGWSVGDG